MQSYEVDVRQSSFANFMWCRGLFYYYICVYKGCKKIVRSRIFCRYMRIYVYKFVKSFLCGDEEVERGMGATLCGSHALWVGGVDGVLFGVGGKSACKRNVEHTHTHTHKQFVTRATHNLEWVKKSFLYIAVSVVVVATFNMQAGKVF